MTRRRRAAADADALELFAPQPPAPPARDVGEALFGPPRRSRAAAAKPAPAVDPYARATPEMEAFAAAAAAAGLDAAASEAELMAAFDAVIAEPVAPPGAIPGTSPASAVTVWTLTQTLKDVVEGAFVPLWIRGEVSDFKAHRNGHFYFCLRDQVAQVRCVMWARDARRFPGAAGRRMQVGALGQVSVYAAAATSAGREGDGGRRRRSLWRKALDQTRARLLADGCWTRRASVRCRAPAACGGSSRVPTGAALHDIIRRRAAGARTWSSWSSLPRRRCRATAPPRSSCAGERVGGGATSTS
jgi:hypothetical protein